MSASLAAAILVVPVQQAMLALSLVMEICLLACRKGYILHVGFSSASSQTALV